MAFITDLNRTNPDRRDNVITLNRTLQQIHIFPASWGASNECKAFLYDNEIRINPSYYHNAGEIHEGKVGHWCSFLRFIRECEQSPYRRCMFIEDDVVLSPSEIPQIEKYLQNIQFQKPILSIGPGGSDRINVFDRKQIPQIWDSVRKDDIKNPTDLQLKPLYQYARQFGHLLDPQRSRSGSSTILSSRIRHIASLDQEIDDIVQYKQSLSNQSKTGRNVNVTVSGNKSEIAEDQASAPPAWLNVEGQFVIDAAPIYLQAMAFVCGMLFVLCWQRCCHAPFAYFDGIRRSTELSESSLEHLI